MQHTKLDQIDFVPKSRIYIWLKFVLVEISLCEIMPLQLESTRNIIYVESGNERVQKKMDEIAEPSVKVTHCLVTVESTLFQRLSWKL